MKTILPEPILTGFPLFVSQILISREGSLIPLSSVHDAYLRWSRHRKECPEAESRQGLVALIERLNADGGSYRMTLSHGMKNSSLVGYEFGEKQLQALAAPIGQMYKALLPPVYPLASYLRDHCQQRLGASVKLKDLMEDYLFNCEVMGSKPEARSSRQAAHKLRIMGIQTEVGGGNYRKVPDIEFKP
jgi:hypothetical protein